MPEHNDEEKLIITPEEAESLLIDGDDDIHNFVDCPGMLIGCDIPRAEAIAAFKCALQIEIAGPGARGMGHGLAVWSDNVTVSFFEADRDKIDALEAAKRRTAARHGEPS